MKDPYIILLRALHFYFFLLNKYRLLTTYIILYVTCVLPEYIFYRRFRECRLSCDILVEQKPTADLA